MKVGCSRGSRGGKRRMKEDEEVLSILELIGMLVSMQQLLSK